MMDGRNMHVALTLPSAQFNLLRRFSERSFVSKNVERGKGYFGLQKVGQKYGLRNGQGKY